MVLIQDLSLPNFMAWFVTKISKYSAYINMSIEVSGDNY